MLLTTSGYQLALFCLLIRSCQAVKNGATETLNAQLLSTVQDTPSSNVSMNQARNGGRRLTSDARKGLSRSVTEQGQAQSQVGCRELRSTKYISDGQCTSLNPVKELVCAGECLPSHLLPNWIGSGPGYTGKFWSRREAQEWRCVIDRTRTQRIRLQCQNGSSRTYKITVVTSCKCKRYSRQNNDSGNGKSEVEVGQAQGQSSTPQGPKRRKGKEGKNGRSGQEDWAEEQPKNY
ncbi:sclerostin domain-containing protein 1 isoform X1 [Salmo trutta]|uniref:sclerostin domain-containing protein 1 isoform X1 n=1 Tax=Salmo trutta TaxID=8032 RepID=UPI00113022C4|nr:sclerostin domain-containing protein 1-like isoform X1 [Salmo trutta]